MDKSPPALPIIDSQARGRLVSSNELDSIWWVLRVGERTALCGLPLAVGAGTTLPLQWYLTIHFASFFLVPCVEYKLKDEVSATSLVY